MGQGLMAPPSLHLVSDSDFAATSSLKPRFWRILLASDSCTIFPGVSFQKAVGLSILSELRKRFPEKCSPPKRSSILSYSGHDSANMYNSFPWTLEDS